ncbi:MAG: zinc-ribbon domain-containing protein [Myxococcota bacterium]
MDVRCPQCRTDYVFDDARLGPRGVAVKCAACRHVFRVYPPGLGAPELRVWQVRKDDGTRVDFKELTTLQRWIVEGLIRRTHEISRDGATWKRLGDIKELEPFFSIVDRAESAERGSDHMATQPIEETLLRQDGRPKDRGTFSSIPALQSHIFNPQDLAPVQASMSSHPSIPVSVSMRHEISPSRPTYRSQDRHGRGAKDRVLTLWAVVGLIGAFAVGAGVYLITLDSPAGARWLEQLGFGPPSSASARSPAPPSLAEGPPNHAAAPAFPPASSGNEAASTAAVPVTEPPDHGADVRTPRPSEPAAAVPSPEESPPKTDREAEHRSEQSRRPRPPSFADVMTKGVASLRDGRLSEALDAFGKASELRPSDPRPHARKGEVYGRMGRPHLAATAYERALREDPELASARLGLARAQLALSRQLDARANLQRILAETSLRDPIRDEAAKLLENL